MHIRQQVLTALEPAPRLDALAAIRPQLALVFADSRHFANPQLLPWLQQALPDCALAGCSTAGEIAQAQVEQGSLVITALNFEHPDFRIVSTPLANMQDSEASGRRLANALAAEDLHDVLIFSQGVNVNGSALINGIQQVLDKSIRLSGGLAGDGAAFKKTYTLGPKGVSEQEIVAVGFYGPHIRLSHGCFGGWQPFGPARLVTRSVSNVLYELDGEPALDIYKRYLGDYAKDLPGSGLLFPFEMLGADHRASGLIRTILAVDEEAGSLTLAGDIIEQGYLRLMQASTDALVDGAEAAAQAAARTLNRQGQQLTLLVSCVGRKLVMGDRVDEEVEAVADVFGQNSLATGFYSYGEISPHFDSPECQLHNQTMTITTITET